MKNALLIVLFGLVLAIRAAQAAAPPTSDLRVRALERFKLSRGDVQELKPMAIARTGEGGRLREVTIPLKLDSQEVTLSLRAHSLRAADFKLFVQREDGVAREDSVLPPATMRGTVLEKPGSVVAGSLTQEGLTASIQLPDGIRWIVQPLRATVAEARQADHLVYRPQDAAMSRGRCGLMPRESKAPAQLSGDQPQSALEPSLAAANGAGPTTLYYAEIAFDTDVEYYRGSVQATVDYVEARLNAVDNIYARDVQIGYRLTAIVVRTAEPDPYTTDNPSLLLDLIKSHWNTTLGDVRRDVVHLLTGRDLEGPQIGLARINVLCNEPSEAQGLSGNNILLSPGFHREVNVLAHELGHNWGADHCGTFQFECGIMAEIGEHAPSGFSNVSRNEIIAHRNQYSACLDVGWTFVDWRATTLFWGTELNPWPTVTQGANATPNGGQLFIRGEHRYLENISLNRPMRLQAVDGAVTIGN